MKFNKKYNMKDLKGLLKNKKVLRIIKTTAVVVIVCVCCVILVYNRVEIPVNAAEFGAVEEVIKEGAKFDFVDTIKDAAQFFLIR